jgi:hypothetical protein
MDFFMTILPFKTLSGIGTVYLSAHRQQRGLEADGLAPLARHAKAPEKFFCWQADA